MRGEEPVFVVTGRKEDVGKAKREILSAAEHFSLIRASRKPSLLGGLTGKGTVPGPPTNIPGQITILVRVPYRVGKLLETKKHSLLFNKLFPLFLSWFGCWTQRCDYQAYSATDTNIYCYTISRQGTRFWGHWYARQRPICPPANRSSHRAPHWKLSWTKWSQRNVRWFSIIRLAGLFVFPSSLISL